MQDEADAWQDFCESLCAELDVALELRRVRPDEAGSREAAARDARYAAIGACLQTDEILLTAHHLDDQLETLLLRLMRGAGPGGLAGMAWQRSLGAGLLCRPLLHIPRAQLQRYAQDQQLSWCEDSSNSDTDLDRNFCRHELLPLVASRWPQYRLSWSKSQGLMAEAAELANELATEDLRRLGVEGGARLRLAGVTALRPARQRKLLLHWLQRLGATAPGWHSLRQLVEEVLPAAGAGGSELALPDGLLRCESGLIQLLRTEPLPEAETVPWRPGAEAQRLLPGNGSLMARPGGAPGLHPAFADAIAVRYREGGERLRLAGRPERTLKKLLQESPLPSWLRPRLPLLYVQGELACVPGIGVAEKFIAPSGEPALRVDWLQPDLVQRPAGGSRGA